MQLSQKNQKLALAAAAGVAAALVIRRKLRTKIRAAFDIGSGEHKLVVAAVNGTSVKVLHSEVSTVLLAQDLTRPGGDGALSAGALLYATVHEVLTVPIVADPSKGLSIAVQLGAVAGGYAGMSLLAIWV